MKKSNNELSERLELKWKYGVVYVLRQDNNHLGRVPYPTLIEFTVNAY